MKNKLLANDIARERIAILFNEAKGVNIDAESGQELARRYVYMARKIAMKIRTPLDLEKTRVICKRCNSYLVDGSSSRVRLQGAGKNAHVVVTCLHCGAIKRYHYRRRQETASRGE
ncbi:MAG TPA: ribonuclease P [Candidatus Lokiarchaeia archaeon]|nr:ribonuclease P [Candidatus Lokiarchaeia archaeon]